MRFPERYKQTVWVSNETYFGSGEYSKPYSLLGIVSPHANGLILGGGISEEQNSVICKFETELKGAKDIMSTSHIWIHKAPDKAEQGGDFTHAVVSRDTTTHKWYVFIECRSVAGNTPIA